MTTNKINETGLSKDYNLLCELIKTQAVICVVNYDFNGNGMIIRDPAICHMLDGSLKYQVYGRGITFIYEKDGDGFVKACQRLNLAFYDPNPWQPIETAPRDGTPVLVTDGDTCEVAKCFGSGWLTNEGYDFEYGTWDVELTHWMPIPIRTGDNV
jgi:hypothetical protein